MAVRRSAPEAVRRSAPEVGSTKTEIDGTRPKGSLNHLHRRRGFDMGLEDLNHNFLTGTLEDLVKWARYRSMWPVNFGLACCGIELMAAGTANFDLARFGMEIFQASPRQADLMIVSGRVMAHFPRRCGGAAARTRAPSAM